MNIATKQSLDEWVEDFLGHLEHQSSAQFRSADAAQALTEGTDEQRRHAQEHAKNQLKEHRQRHGIFYLAGEDKEAEGGAVDGDDGSAGLPEQSANSETGSADGALAGQQGGGMDSAYSKMRKKKSRHRKKSAVVEVRRWRRMGGRRLRMAKAVPPPPPQQLRAAAPKMTATGAIIMGSHCSDAC